MPPAGFEPETPDFMSATVDYLGKRRRRIRSVRQRSSKVIYTNCLGIEPAMRGRLRFRGQDSPTVPGGAHFVGTCAGCSCTLADCSHNVVGDGRREPHQVLVGLGWIPEDGLVVQPARTAASIATQNRSTMIGSLPRGSTCHAGLRIDPKRCHGWWPLDGVECQVNGSEESGCWVGAGWGLRQASQDHPRRRRRSRRGRRRVANSMWRNGSCPAACGWFRLVSDPRGTLGYLGAPRGRGSRRTSRSLRLLAHLTAEFAVRVQPKEGAPLNDVAQPDGSRVSGKVDDPAHKVATDVRSESAVRDVAGREQQAPSTPWR